jgi:small subunit ribosomal protein S4
VTPNHNGQAARIKENLERTKDRPATAWIQVDAQGLKGVIVRSPQKDDIGLPIQEQLIVELYSK